VSSGGRYGHQFVLNPKTQTIKEDLMKRFLSVLIAAMFLASAAYAQEPKKGDETKTEAKEKSKGDEKKATAKTKKSKSSKSTSKSKSKEAKDGKAKDEEKKSDSGKM
jgi:cytoskeletal protein RodZ